MFKTNLKNKRGFSLVELMVVVAIMGTLAAIAIPAYNEYRKSAKKAAYRADLTSLHKGWLAFGVEIDSFCDRKTSPQNASIVNVGMASLLSSKLYNGTSNKWSFIGFAAQDHPGTGEACTTTPTAQATVSTPLVAADRAIAGIGSNGGGVAVEDADCVLGITEYKMGVFGHISGEDFIGYEVNQNGIVNERAPTTGDMTGLGTTCV